MYETSRTIELILTMLAATPSHLADLTSGLPQAQLLAPPEPGDWSVRDVLAHLGVFCLTPQNGAFELI
ncbi:MAG: DinB family protein [Herpetosiphonaceae bacterium]|nr:DinB family protein [Herpetosiphonaceae bacterium]